MKNKKWVGGQSPAAPRASRSPIGEFISFGVHYRLVCRLGLPSCAARLSFPVRWNYSKRKRAFRRALGKFYRRVASFCRFLVRRFIVLSFRRSVVGVVVVLSFRRWIAPQVDQKSGKMHQKLIQNLPKFFKHLSKIHRKSQKFVQNPSKINQKPYKI